MAAAHRLLAIIPAREGSSRVPGKNVRRLAGHPLLAYSIAGAVESGLFSRIIVSTDSPAYADIAKHYGAECPELRPVELATSLSPDIGFLRHTFDLVGDGYDVFSILRPTSPFRTGAVITRAWEAFREVEGADSIRAVQLCREHPGKMWVFDEGDTFMRPLLEQSHLEVPWYASQYQALPRVHVQNSSLEIAWSRVVLKDNSREGRNIVPFLTKGAEGFTIDYPDDWALAEQMVARGEAVLPRVTQAPYQGGESE